MAKVDFYVLENANRQRHDVFLCRLIHKAWRQGLDVFVHTGDGRRATEFDALLWTYQDISFVPHRLADSDAAPAPVTIAAGDSADRNPAALLVNLAPDAPGFADQHERIAESAGYDNATRALARQRFRAYQAGGRAMDTHRLTL
ncbi:MAG: DNA polymerase III subunit chi [Gammaproteobacteria bacterium]|nr:DNA polymerase III subunit chi [Gammaproteobacteria bacterium]NNL99347.1 DNA polymerase III subunit chi [Gammaproteobacteria bacterium]